VHAEQETDGRGGEGEIGRIGVSAAAQEVGEGADEDHADGEEGEGRAEESHGAAGEIEDVAEREIVDAALSEERGDVGVRVGVGCGDGEEEGDRCGERADGD
jgi:hypothetical protein